MCVMVKFNYRKHRVQVAHVNDVHKAETNRANRIELNGMKTDPDRRMSETESAQKTMSSMRMRDGLIVVEESTEKP